MQCHLLALLACHLADVSANHRPVLFIPSPQRSVLPSRCYTVLYLYNLLNCVDLLFKAIKDKKKYIVISVFDDLRAILCERKKFQRYTV